MAGALATELFALPLRRSPLVLAVFGLATVPTLVQHRRATPSNDMSLAKVLVIPIL